MAVRRKCGNLGIYPYLVYPILNFDKLIPYFVVSSGCEGVARRRAWLVPPTAVDDPATIRLESVRMNLGCAGSPQQATIMTPILGVGAQLPQSVPVVFGIYNTSTGGSYMLGLAETLSGNLLYTAPGAITPVTDTFFVLNQPPGLGTLRYGRYTLATTQNGRVLRGLPTLSPDVLQLAWVDPAADAGYPVEMVLVSTECVAPDCGNLRSNSLFPPGTVFAGVIPE